QAHRGRSHGGEGVMLERSHGGEGVMEKKGVMVERRGVAERGVSGGEETGVTGKRRRCNGERRGVMVEMGVG
ncbi:hypothetical protein PV325_009477, partial [Microctonus aethiopoides]